MDKKPTTMIARFLACFVAGLMIGEAIDNLNQQAIALLILSIAMILLTVE